LGKLPKETQNSLSSACTDVLDWIDAQTNPTLADLKNKNNEVNLM